MDETIKQLEERVRRLEEERRNDFSSLKVFNKSVEVQGYIHLKEYAANPTPAREGDVAYVAGKLKLCTVGGSSPTWVVVGTQT